jgi:hypothetical protein
MRLPHADSARVSKSKVIDYLLNQQHPDGRGKAEFFSAAGFETSRWQELAEAIGRLVEQAPVAQQVDSPHGRK